MAVGDIISRDDYNSIQTIVQRVLGTGSSNTGYGQPVLSSQVSEGQKVTIQEWDNVRNDIINIYRHQNGTIPTLPSAIEAQKIRYNVTDSVWNKFLTEVQDLDLDTTRFNIGQGQFLTTDFGSTDFTGSWKNKLSCVVSTEFTTSENARLFFNSGGKINFSSTRSGGTETGGSQTIRAQNEAWTLLLTDLVATFGGGTPGTGISPLDGKNFYRLTDTFQLALEFSASSPYGSNDFRISAKTPDISDNNAGTAKLIEFLVEWDDGHTPQGVSTLDGVDGTMTLFVDTIDPTFNLVPAAAIPVPIEVPEITLGTITGN